MGPPSFCDHRAHALRPEHVDRYRATDGEEGHYWQGALTLLLTTTGRKSGEQRTTPLVYGRRGDDLLIVASRGGTVEPPAWYRNLEAHPEVGVQVKGDVFEPRPGPRRPRSGPSCGGRWPATGSTTTPTRATPTARSRWSCSSARARVALSASDFGREARGSGGSIPGRVAMVEHQVVAVGVGEERHVADPGVENVA